MKLVKPSIEFLNMTEEPLRAIERAGRTCYKSEDKITEDSAEKFVGMLLKRGHEAMLEHASASYRIICDRGVTHEIVRHRLFSYAQESTRYCNYKGGVEFIIPPWVYLMQGWYDKDAFSDHPNTPTNYWAVSMVYSEIEYKNLLSAGQSPQQARSVLPNSLKTEIVVTGNLRQWKEFFKQRCAKTAHPQMQEVANMVLEDIQQRVPVIFDMEIK